MPWGWTEKPRATTVCGGAEVQPQLAPGPRSSWWTLPPSGLPTCPARLGSKQLLPHKPWSESSFPSPRGANYLLSLFLQ